ncbi:MAG: phytanoyl-CoA dioxygenase family protein [Pseudomonadota bacterium]|nr:phytanoyl-CoA dioxygenase family protein [Pseudomonadota bacterium]
MTNSFAGDTSPEAVVDAVSRDGYAVVRDAVDPETVAAVSTDLAPFLEDAHKGHEEFFGKLTKRFGALLAKSTAVQSLLVHPTVLAVADHALLPHCVRYHVHYTGVMHLEPGETRQVLHRDTSIYPIANPCPPMTVATMWAVSDFTRQNGGTRLVPGSHLWSNERVPKPAEVVATEMTPGSVLIYTGNVIHGGGANHADQPRTGVALHYNLGWLRQEENQYLAVPQEIARKLPHQIQELMGYALGSSSLGFVDHIEPKDYLHGVRDQAKSSLGPPELRERVDALDRLHFSHTEKGNLRYYDIDTD